MVAKGDTLMPEDVVISVVQNYNWEQIRCYANSLVRTGFAGTKLMLAKNITPDARIHLIDLGFQVVDFFIKRETRFVQCDRFEPAVKFLRNRHFRYVIWTDVRDLVFQTNPSMWLEKNLKPHRIVAATEYILVKNEPYNDRWMRDSVPTDVHKWLREQEICCGGTLVGEHEVMCDVLAEVYRLTSLSSKANDQSVLNYVLRVSPFKEVTRIPKREEGFTANCGLYLAEDGKGLVRTEVPLTLDRERAVVYVPGTDIPFSIVHQYDRDPVWKDLIERKYR